MLKRSAPKNLYHHKSITSMTSDIDHFFNPRSIAVIGVSRNPRKFGHIIFRNLNNDAVKTDAEGVIRSASSVFDKKVFPVKKPCLQRLFAQDPEYRGVGIQRLA